MKRLYTFTVNKEEEVEERVTEKAESGEEKIVIQKVKKQVPKTFFLAKPTRTQIDASEVYYGATIAEAIRKGFINHALLAKRIEDDGGAMSETERKHYIDLLTALFKTTEGLQKLQIVSEESRTEEQKNEFKKLLEEQIETQKEIQQIEMNQLGLFEQTAEAYSRRRTLMWWVMQIAYQEQDGKETPLFGEGSFEERLKKYDETVELEDATINEAIRRFTIYIPFWYIGRASKSEDFDKIDVKAA